MALSHSPQIVTNGLAFYYDMANTQKSWRGAPTTNLASWNVVGQSFNTDTPGNLTQTANSSEMLYQGNLSRKMVINAGSFWNCYTYGYNTGISSTVYAASCKIKTADGSHPNTFIGGGYIYGSATSAVLGISSFTEDLDGWYIVTWIYSGAAMTLNSLTGLYGTPTSSKTFFMADYQVEALSFSTPFAGVGGVRSGTQSLIDLTGIHTIPTTSLTYNSNNTFSFNGSTNRITGVMPSGYTGTDNTLGRSWEVVARPGAAITTTGLFGHVLTAGCSYFCNGGICIWNGRYHFAWFDNVSYQFLDSGINANNGQYVHIIGTWSPADLRARIYVNGELRATGAATNLNYGGSVNEFQVGYFSASGNPYTGIIDIAKYYYNKTLTDIEVQQNFNALRGRYSI